MTSPKELSVLLGSARFQTYIDAAAGDLERAGELYAWGTSLSGAWHAHIGYIEVAVRNAIDRELRPWNAAHSGPYSEDWTVEHGAAQPLYGILAKPLREARDTSVREAQRRPFGHARKNATPNHDDVVAQLMFGAWARLVMPPSGPDRENERQKQLWQEALHKAFPAAEPNERGRRYVGRQLEAIRKLRNRIAHHENLLSLPIIPRLNGSLALLSMINSEFPDLVMGRNPLRQLASEDPRLRWSTP